MKFIAKHPKYLSRKELNMFFWLLDHLSLTPSLCIEKIKKCHIIWLCMDRNNIVWISAIKQPRASWTETVQKNTGIHLPKNIFEYWYIYVLPSHRWQWITKRIYALLHKKIHFPVYAITKSDNIPMKKLLEQFGFIKAGKSFKSILDGKYLDFFLKTQ